MPIHSTDAHRNRMCVDVIQQSSAWNQTAVWRIRGQPPLVERSNRRNRRGGRRGSSLSLRGRSTGRAQDRFQGGLQELASTVTISAEDVQEAAEIVAASGVPSGAVNHCRRCDGASLLHDALRLRGIVEP